MPRINNNIIISDISAIYTYPGSFIPSLSVAFKTASGEEQKIFEETQIVEFLNSTTDIKNGGKNRTISSDLEDIIISHTGVVFLKDGQYHYKEPIRKQKLKTKPFFNKQPPWWQDDSNFDKIVEFASTILSTFPSSRIFSLGQSPAWIVKASEMLAKARSEKGEFGYIPFSGSFLDRQKEFSGNFYIGDRPFPNTELQENYRKYLQGIGLSPQEIIIRAKEGSKTTILEYTNTGVSVASFALILFSWAKEEKIEQELMASLDIVTFARNTLPPVTVLNISPLFMSISCTNLYAENALLVSLANGVDTGANSDRIVPHYSQSLWNLPPAPVVENIEHVKTLSDKLQQSVIKKILTEASLTHFQLDCREITSPEMFKRRHDKDKNNSYLGL
ncbi:hypothetical protein NF27_BC00020 [Candidatus Jidaibacter acanthamoeba]|uniref:Uncharacterized protein n=1 Tax=Candidatus Jidaibacter acanthamoebae TaxID=86105 RepID=A0A0C1R1S0_9RICK|nr:hypothetical protein [Candidatus Jidaibacter acanthamoeba]KIE06215.1 hypothetical protein NF27_BC00020 [Candidatus Jidaibacter acanthamoeba]